MIKWKRVSKEDKEKGKVMKKKLGIWLAVILTFCMYTAVLADAGKSQQVDYKTDYYMIVESPDGGVDMYSETDASSPKLNDELIPNGTVIHVEGESKDDTGEIWAYAQLHNVFGFFEENYLKPATLAEAVASELQLFGSEEVNYSITVNAKEDGSVSLYKGPGKKYGTVSGGCKIANGESLYIDTEVDTGKDGVWGHTSAGDVSGWVNIAEATNTQENAVELIQDTADKSGDREVVTSADSQEAEDQNSADQETGKETILTPVAESGNTVTPTSEPTNTSTPTPEPTNTSTPTPEPTSISTPTPEPTNTSTPTPEPTNTSTPTPEPTNTNTPTPEPTETSTPTPEPTETNTPTPEPTETSTPTPEPTETSAPTSEPTETVAPSKSASATPVESDGQEASSENVTETSNGMSYIIWILIVVILIGIAVVIWLLKKKGKDNKND